MSSVFFQRPYKKWVREMCVEMFLYKLIPMFVKRRLWNTLARDCLGSIKPIFRGWGEKVCTKLKYLLLEQCGKHITSMLIQQLIALYRRIPIYI